MLRSVARRCVRCSACRRRRTATRTPCADPDHGQRLIRRRPANRVRVDARVSVGTAAGLIDRLDAELHGGNRRVLPELLHEHLVHRGADADVRAFGQLRTHVREHHRVERKWSPPTSAGGIRFGHAHVRVADDRQVIAEGFERTEAALGDVELAADDFRVPEELRGPELTASRRSMHLLDADEPRAVRGHPSPGAGKCRARRDHRVQQRQRDRGAQTPERRAARHVFSSQIHRGLLLVDSSRAERGAPSPRREKEKTARVAGLGVAHDAANRRHVVYVIFGAPTHTTSAST